MGDTADPDERRTQQRPEHPQTPALSPQRSVGRPRGGSLARQDPLDARDDLIGVAVPPVQPDAAATSSFFSVG